MTKKMDSLMYHSTGRKGKIEVISSKPCLTSRDLSLAYTPGVAEPCLEIEKTRRTPTSTQQRGTSSPWYPTAPRCSGWAT